MIDIDSKPGGACLGAVKWRRLHLVSFTRVGDLRQAPGPGERSEHDASNDSV